MASSIEKRHLDKWILGLFEAHKTTREIEEIVNAELARKGEEPVSQPTIARFLKPYREARQEEKRNIINATFHEDLEQLNLLIRRNTAIANGIDWDHKRNVPKVRPDGSYMSRHYKIREQIQASKVAISAIMKKFEHLRPEERRVYAEVSAPGGEPIVGSRESMSDPELNERISQLLAKLGGIEAKEPGGDSPQNR